MTICTIVALLAGAYVVIDLIASAVVVHRFGGLRAAANQIRSNLKG